MTVVELKKALARLPDDLYVCGLAGDETICLFSGVAEEEIADAWHDSLPTGSKYVHLRFEKVIPHIRGEGVFQEQVPTPPPKVQKMQCPDCLRVYDVLPGKDKDYCQRCSWSPMLHSVEEL